MARKRESTQEPGRDWDLEEHQRQVIRLYMRQRGFSRVRMGALVGMSGNAFGLRVQENWGSEEPQPVFKPVELYRIMDVLGIGDANLLFRPATLALVPTFADEPNESGLYNLYYHGDPVVASGRTGAGQRIPA